VRIFTLDLHCYCNHLWHCIARYIVLMYSVTHTAILTSLTIERAAVGLVVVVDDNDAALCSVYITTTLIYTLTHCTALPCLSVCLSVCLRSNVSHRFVFVKHRQMSCNFTNSWQNHTPLGNLKQTHDMHSPPHHVLYVHTVPCKN